MVLGDLKQLYIDSAQSWAKDNASRLAAAFSFYAILSLTPLIVLAIAIASRFLDGSMVEERLLSEAGGSLGTGTAEFLKELIDKSSHPGFSTIAGLLSFGVALYGASNMFGQLFESINSIWGVPVEGNAFANFIRGKVLSILAVLIFAALVLAWMVLDSVLGWIARRSGGFLGWPLVSVLVSTLFLAVVFGFSYKAIPKGRVQWKHVWIGAITAAIGFSLAKSLLALYFSFSGVAAVYGPAGSLVVILLWVYYSAMIYFFGVELVYNTANRGQADRPPASVGGAAPKADS